MAWRCKSMTFEEWAAFQDRFEELFMVLGGPRAMMLLKRADPADPDRKILLVNDHERDLVEALSPGAWDDCPDAPQHEWQLLVAHHGAPEELGITLGLDHG